MKRETMKLNHGVILRVPTVPNYISVCDSQEKIHVKSFSDKQLREIGKAWTNELIANARRDVK